MTLGHERLNVYRLSIGYVAWVYEKAKGLGGVHRPARDQWLRASRSIPLNIAEGNGKTAAADRRRSFGIARGSAPACAASQDVLDYTPKPLECQCLTGVRGMRVVSAQTAITFCFLRKHAQHNGCLTTLGMM